MTFIIGNDVEDGSSGVPINYKAYVYEWDDTNWVVVGSAIFESPTLVIPLTLGPEEFTVNTPGTQLIVGKTYIAFFSTNNILNPTDLVTFWGSVIPATYTDGVFVFNGTTDFTTKWGRFSRPINLAFEFVFRSSVPCLHPNTQVLCAKEYKAISSLKQGDLVTDRHGQEQPILYNLQFDRSNDFILIPKGSLTSDDSCVLPCNDLLIRKGHPILLNGKTINPAKLIGKVEGVKKTKLNDPVPVYSLCMKKRNVYVIMEGIPVKTWSEYDIMNSKYKFSKH